MGLDQLYTGRAGMGNKIRNLSQCEFHVHGLVVTVQAARRITGGTCSSFLLSVLFLLCVFLFYCSLLFRYCSFVVFLYTA